MKAKLYTALTLVIFVAIAGCAKIGSPYGGPKDEDPPKVLRTKPPENSVNFVPQKRIQIYFDEFIQLKDIFTEMMISPPLEDRLSAMLKGRILVLEFPPDTEFDSVTYTISFGSAITDNNEGNVLKNYTYVFSLKPYIDSLHVEGTIVNAFNHLPDEDRMLVMLYRNLNDSAPLLEKPSYVCRTDDEGNFALHNISPGTYRIFGLKDGNQNMLYDLPNEQIAFSDSLIVINAERFEDDVIIQDSVLLDSLAMANLDSLPDGDTVMAFSDTVAIDSVNTDDIPVIAMQKPGKESPLVITDSTLMDSTLADSSLNDSIIQEKYYALYTELFFFTPEVYNQYMTNYLRPRREQLFFSFNETINDSFALFPLNYVPESDNWYLLDASEQMDTLKYWITDTSMLAMDSLEVEMCYPVYDSNEVLFFKSDTFLLQIQDDDKQDNNRSRSGRSRRKDKDEEVDTIPNIEFTNNIKNLQAFELNTFLKLVSETPLDSVIADSVKLFRLEDTLEFAEPLNVSLDTSSFYRLNLRFEPESETRYRLFIPDSIIRDIYGTVNDTIEIQFKTRSLNFYGTLSLNLSNVQSPIILQLMDEKENVLREKFIQEDGKQTFDYLAPKKYKLKVIVDRNQNGKWDTGDYLEKLQPERVIYYPDLIDIRSNWEVETNWVLP